MTANSPDLSYEAGVEEDSMDSAMGFDNGEDLGAEFEERLKEEGWRGDEVTDALRAMTHEDALYLMDMWSDDGEGAKMDAILEEAGFGDDEKDRIAALGPEDLVREMKIIEGDVRDLQEMTREQIADNYLADELDKMAA